MNPLYARLPSAMEKFEPAARFMGPVPDFFFGTGPLGTGYYFDQAQAWAQPPGPAQRLAREARQPSPALLLRSHAVWDFLDSRWADDARPAALRTGVPGKAAATEALRAARAAAAAGTALPAAAPTPAALAVAAAEDGAALAAAGAGAVPRAWSRRSSQAPPAPEAAARHSKASSSKSLRGGKGWWQKRRGEWRQHVGGAASGRRE